MDNHGQRGKQAERLIEMVRVTFDGSDKWADEWWDTISRAADKCRERRRPEEEEPGNGRSQLVT